MELTHLSLDCQAKAVDEEARTVDVIMSTPDIDRHGERVTLNWRLDSFKANPTVLWAHNADELPLGTAENVRVERRALRGTIHFASAEANPKAEQVFRLFKEKVLKSVSVGFIPHSYRFEKENDEEILILDDNELVELSVTPTPANPFALAKMKALAKAEQTNGASKQKDLPAAPESPALPSKTTSNAQKDTEMDVKELQDKIEKQAAALATLEAETKASMQTLEKANKALDEKVKALESENASLKTDKAAFEAQTKTLAEQRDAEKKRADEAEGKTIELEVSELVGKKISAAEKPAFVELRKTNKSLFDQMIEQRQPMRLEEAVVAETKTDGDGVDTLLAEFKSA